MSLVRPAVEAIIHSLDNQQEKWQMSGNHVYLKGKSRELSFWDAGVGSFQQNGGPSLKMSFYESWCVCRAVRRYKKRRHAEQQRHNSNQVKEMLEK